jgi:hypothetical protein
MVTFAPLASALAFSSEVAIGSREENAPKQTNKAISVLRESEPSH